jgi:hypothetical protein
MLNPCSNTDEFSIGGTIMLSFIVRVNVEQFGCTKLGTVLGVIVEAILQPNRAATLFVAASWSPLLVTPWRPLAANSRPTISLFCF